MITAECADCKRGFHNLCDGGAWIHGEPTECACYMDGAEHYLDEDDQCDDEEPE